MGQARGKRFFRVGEIEDNTTTAFTDEGGLPVEADPDASPGDDAQIVDKHVRKWYATEGRIDVEVSQL